MKTFVIRPPAEDIHTPEEARRAAAYLRDSEITMIGLDTETSGLNTTNDRIYYFSMATDNKRWAFPTTILCVDEIVDIIEGSQIDKVFTNAKFDIHMFANMGISVGGLWYDTVMMDALYDDGVPHGLKECMKRYFDMEMESFTQVFGKKKKDETTLDLLERADPVKRADYASLDAWASLKLFSYLREQLMHIDFGKRTGWEYYCEFEIPFTRLLWEMEREGIYIDIGHLKDMENEFQPRIDAIEKEFCKHAGMLINLNSPKQLREFFFGALGRTPIAMTKGGDSGDPVESLNEKTISVWAEEGDVFAKMLLEQRKLNKLMGTYIVGLQKRTNPDLRIHTTFNQAGARTGRLSSSDPNLQNIPSRGTDGKRIREAFIARVPEETLIVADYSQLEMRILAHFSADKKMIDAINEGLDLHCFTASKFLNVDYDTVLAAKKKDDAELPLTAEEKDILGARRAAKTIGFGLVYGMQAQRLAAELGISLEEAKKARLKYLSTFPMIDSYMRSIIKYCRKHGYVTTLFGRRRFLPINSNNFAIQGEAERAAVNTPIQGSAADIVKLAQLRCWKSKKLAGLCTKESYVKQVLQVHDELCFRATKNVAVEAMVYIKDIMENVLGDKPLAVALPVSAHMAGTWAEAK